MTAITVSSDIRNLSDYIYSSTMIFIYASSVIRNLFDYYLLLFSSCLRVDSLGQILTQSNVKPGINMMVVESCLGLVTGAVMERMAGRYN